MENKKDNIFDFIQPANIIEDGKEYLWHSRPRPTIKKGGGAIMLRYPMVLIKLKTHWWDYLLHKSWYEIKGMNIIVELGKGSEEEKECLYEFDGVHFYAWGPFNKDS